jgi:Big-like domain-containing protein
MKRQLLAPAFAAALLMGCPGGEGGVGGVLVVASVEVTPSIVDVVFGTTQQLTAVPKTSSGIAVQGRTPTWSTTDAAIATVSTSGLVTPQTVGGPVRIRATVDGVSGDAVITVRPVPVDHVTVEPPSANVLVQGQVLLTAKAFDANNGLLTGRSFLWQSSDHSIATVTTTGLAIGVREGGPVLISATAEGKTGTSSVSVSTRPATRLTFIQQPGLSVAGQIMAPPIRVALQDDLLTTVVGAPNPVTIALAGNPGGATLTGQKVVTPSNGIATFSDLVLDRVGTAYTFQVTSPGLLSATSSPFDVIAGSANQLGFTTAPPGTAQSGVILAPQPALQLKDASGNNVAQANVPITATIATGPSGASLSGTTVVNTNSSGLASFGTLALRGPVGAYTLSFGTPGVTPIVSGTIALSAGPATALFLATAPGSTAQSSSPLVPQPAVQLRDASGNNVAQSGVTVTASIGSGPAGSAVGGTTSAVTNPSGLAQFTGLSISGPPGSYTLVFSSPTLTSATSGSIILGAGAATQLAIVTQPSSVAQSGTAFLQQPAVALRDASNNPVAQAGVSISVAINSGGGTLSGTIPATTNSSGVATFSGLTITGAAGNRTLIFSSTGLSSVISGAITVSAATATQLTYNQQPSSTAQSGVPFAQQPILLLRDAANNPVAGVVVTATITGAPAGVSRIGTTTATTNGSGVATFVGSGLGLSGTPGNYTLTFTAGAVSSAASNSIALSAGTATQLTYNTQPSTTATSGQAFSTQPVLLLRDGSNNPVGGVLVTATITGSPSGVAFVGTTSVTTNGSGLAIFVGLGLNGPAGNYSLTFTTTTPSLSSPASNTIALSAGGATQLTYNTQPSSTASSGVALGTQPALLLRDASNNPVASTAVTATVTGNPAGVTLSNSSALTNGSGVATFSGLALSGPVGNYTLTFISGAVTSIASNTIALGAGSATQLAITQQPVGGASGAALATQPVVAIRDAQGNTVTTNNSTQVTVAIVSGAGGALGGTQTVTAVNGIATFGTLTLSGTVGVNYVLRFTANPALTAINSGNVTVTAGAAFQLGITQQPVGGADGAALATQPVIAVQDAQGNRVTTDNTTQVTVAIFSGAGGTLGGIQTVTAVAGLATFTNLTLDGTVGVSYVLRFSSNPALTAVNSGNVTVTAGPAAQLAISQQPVGGASGAALATQPVILIQDAQGNTVSDNTTQVAVAIFSGAGGSLGGTQTVTAVNGTATFTNVTLTGTVGMNYVLRFTANPALTAVNSNNVTVTAGAAAQLAITTQPVGGASGAALATQPVVAVRDGGGNLVTTDNTTQVSVAIFSGTGGTLGGTQTVTVVNGVATFATVTLAGTVGTNYVLRFTSSPALTPVNSSNVTVTPGPATKLGLLTQPVGGVSGAALATQPVVAIQDAQGNTVATDGTTQVTVAILSGAGGTLGGTTTVTAVNGLATFTNVTLTGTAGTNYVLSFTSNPALTEVHSNNVTVSAGGATQLGITQQPVGGASGAPLATQPVVAIQDAQGSTVGSDNTTQVSVAVSGGGILGGTTLMTAVNGVVTFTDLTLAGTVGTNYVLQFTSSPLTAANSNNVTVTAGVATQLTYNTQPSTSATYGQAFTTQPVLLLRDAQNNPVPSTQVTATITGSPAGVSLVGTPTATTNGSGLASFSGLGLRGPDGSYTLTFTAGAVSSAASNSIALSGEPSQLAISQQPVGGASGAALATQPIILVRDANGNTVTGDNTTQVTVTIFSGTGGTLGGTQTVTAVNGVATFTNVTLAGTVGVNYVLRFTSNPSLTAVNSNNVTVTAGAAAQMVITQPPGPPPLIGGTLSPQPIIQVQDAQGNAVAGVSVTVSKDSGPGTLGGTLTVVSDASGNAVYTDLTLSSGLGMHTLRFKATGIPDVVSAPF